jgi:hypothetical protein
MRLKKTSSEVFPVAEKASSCSFEKMIRKLLAKKGKEQRSFLERLE